MRGITYDKINNRWRYNRGEINITKKNYEEIMEMAKQQICTVRISNNSGKNVGNFEKYEKKCIKKFFTYQNHYFICYWEDNEPYFDIQHIISVLNLKKSSWYDKYDEFRNNIKHNKLHKNKYGGYILREMINEKTTYQIILSSNSTISKSFKKDVSKILANLRKEGQLNISNDKITLNKKTLYGMNESNDKIINNTTYPIYYYNNPRHSQFIRHLIKLGSNTSLSKFINKHVLYALIIPLKTDNDCVILKIGYTESINDRLETLQAEYKSNVYFIKAKIISGQKDEEKFHKIIKTKYNSLIEHYEINNNWRLLRGTIT
jgi:prophage antirepressor-like protein